MRILLVVAALLVTVPPAASQSLQDCYNGVGVFLEDTVRFPTWWCSTGPPYGTQFDIYVVLVNPWNEVTGIAPTSIAGFEMRIEWPENWFVTAHMPDGSASAATPPDFACSGADIPVVDNQCVLIRLECSRFAEEGTDVYVRPLSDTDYESITGEIAVIDANDLSVSRATPMRYDYDLPVMWHHGGCVVLGQAVDDSWGDCWPEPVDATERSWGSVKALYR